MTARTYYNDNDEVAIAWLRALIKAGELPEGEVDGRSIEDVCPDDLRGFRHCHFFAGIGGWPRALRRAGWPDEREVWTGSCPCQPFSAIGKGAGFTDERHLWPAWHWLIGERRPLVILGEQVTGPAGRAWLDLVCTDMEAIGYACWPVDLPAASVGAPNIRQRLFFVAERERRAARRVGHAHRAGCETPLAVALGDRARFAQLTESSALIGLGHTVVARLERLAGHGDDRIQSRRLDAATARSIAATGATSGAWGECDWLDCRDHKWRPVEPDTFPLAHGISGRVGRLRGYGNAINPELAAAFVAAYLDA